MNSVDDSDYAVGEMSAELQAEYDAKMAEYYDYENYEENYIDYGYDYGTKAPVVTEKPKAAQKPGSNLAGLDLGSVDDSDYAVGEMSAELQAEYDAKMAEYYDYENYEENYMAYGYDYGDEVVTDPCNDGTHNCNALASCISGRLENFY